MNDINEFISRLHNCTNYTLHYDQLTTWGTKPKILVDLFIELRSLKVNFFDDMLMCSLTLTASPENIHCTFNLVIELLHSLKLRQIAGQLATAQDKDELLKAIDMHLNHKNLHGFFRMILQEIVIRKREIGVDKLLNEINHRLEESRLSILPLCLMAIETELYSKDYRIGQAGGGRPTPLFNNQMPITYEERHTSICNYIKTIENHELEKQCLVALDDWIRNSNGKGLVKTGVLETIDFEVEKIIGTLFKDFFQESTILRIAPCVPSRVFSMLYSAASNGGAYSKGEDGAYGRLKAWYSFLGLFGKKFSRQNIETINEELSNYLCFEFISNVWFYRELYWDIGIVCFDKRTNNVQVLIASDAC